MSRRTLFLIFALFLITAVLLVLALYQPQAPKVAPVPVVKEAVAQTSLSFGTPTVATSSSFVTTNYSMPINISTGKNKVTAVQLELQYDPLLLTNVKVTPDLFFPKPNILLNQVDVKTGRVSYAFGIGPTDQGVVGTSTVATLTFSVKAGTLQKTAVVFLPKTLVTAEGIAESVLKPTSAGVFMIGANNSTQSAVSK